MNKKLLFLTLVLGIGLLSCQDKIDGGEVVEDGLVDVTLTTKSESTTKSLVSSGGYTTWAAGDSVYVVDAEGTPRKFINTSQNNMSSAVFKGKLLANHGRNYYYAYHAAYKAPCVLNGLDLNVSREDLQFHLVDATKANKKGEYCTMIAIPVEFDAEDPEDPKDFNFYHVNSLIEARVYPDVLSDGLAEDERLANMVFDKVVFTVKAIEPPAGKPAYNNLNPFNTNVTFNMEKIEFFEDTEAVYIPYKEGTVKVNEMTSTITYDSGTTFASRYTPDSEYYDIPIYALPTSVKFWYQCDVIFYNAGEKVYHVQKTDKVGTDGLRLASLNDINFTYKDNRVVEP